MIISKGLHYVGVSDREPGLFEGQFDVPEGMAYNSYIIEGEKVAVADSVDGKFGKEWMENISSVLGNREPEYLIVHHMEPDHSANIMLFAETYKNAVIVSSKQAFVMMKNYFGTDFSTRRIIVGDGDELDLGGRVMKFFTAPMVHWPEVIVSYDAESKTLFSADGFGKFGAFDVDADWACEARRYYFGIVGKYGVQVQALLKKAAALDIKRICPLHGPVLDGDLSRYLNLYNIWSSYGVESEGVAIAYTSVYGHTKEAVELLAEELKKLGCPKVAVSDLIRDDMAEAVEDAFRYGKIILATTTYNADVFPQMKTFIEALSERNYANRKIGFIENGSWAPMAAKVMKGMTEGFKNTVFCENGVKILGAVSEANKEQIAALAKEILE